MKMKKLMYFLMVAVVMLTITCRDDDDNNGGVGKIVPVTGVALDQSEFKVAPGYKAFFKAIITPEDATNKAVKWSSSHPAAVEIDETTGEFYAKVVTDATITITVKTVDGDKTATRTLTVVDIPVIGVELTDEWVAIGAGRKKTLKANVLSQAAANKNVTWESNNTAVATIHPTNGEVTAHATGVAKITVTTVDGGYKASCYVRVPSSVNLLKNPSFEEPNNTSAELQDWTKMTESWFASYYPGNAGSAPAEGQTNRVRYAGDTFFTTGNGAFFRDYLIGDKACRIAGNNTGGLYQLIEVTAGKSYWYSIDVGFSNNNGNQAIKPYETLKILSTDGATLYDEAPIPTNNQTTGALPIPGVSGCFTVPAGVTEVRYQFDQRAFANPNNGCLALFDNCEFRELPALPE